MLSNCVISFFVAEEIPLKYSYIQGIYQIIAFMLVIGML